MGRKLVVEQGAGLADQVPVTDDMACTMDGIEVCSLIHLRPCKNSMILFIPQSTISLFMCVLFHTTNKTHEKTDSCV